MQTIVLRVKQQWQTATLETVGWISFCSLLFFASKWTGKLFQGVPGHSGMFWIPALFLAHANLRKTGGSTLTALMGTSLWGLGKGGGFHLAPYLAAGMVLDALEINMDRLRSLPFALVGGALCHLAKYAFHNLPVVVLGLPATFLTWGAIPTAGLHLFFGLIGGFLGWLLLAEMNDYEEEHEKTFFGTIEGCPASW